MKSTTFTTSTGRVVKLQAVSPLLLDRIPHSLEKEWKRLGKALPKKPVYFAQTMGGGLEPNEHDEKSLTTDEDKRAWAEWQKAQAEWDAETNRRVLYAILLEGVLDEHPTPQWEARQRAIGLDVPDEEFEKQLAYVQTEIIRTSDDLTGIVRAVLELAGVKGELTATAVETFPGAVEGQAA